MLAALIFVNLWNLLLNAFIHEWLSERGLVSLVVSLLAITDNVDNDVFPELGAPVGSHLTDEIDSFHIITIHMDDGSIDCFGNIRAVRRRSSKARISGEPNLVVHHNVNSTSSRVCRERMESHCFVDDPLSGKCGITVEENAHGRYVLLFVFVEMLDRPSFPKHNGIVRFQMR